MMRMDKNFTPPFPAYPSGHATFGAAAFHMTRLFYDGVAAKNYAPDKLFDGLTFVSDEFNGVNADNKGTVRPKHVRNFPGGLWQMIEENGRSRVYLGVHWVFDAFAGPATAPWILTRTSAVCRSASRSPTVASRTPRLCAIAGSMRTVVLFPDSSAYLGTSSMSMNGDLPGLSKRCCGNIGSYQYSASRSALVSVGAIALSETIIALSAEVVAVSAAAIVSPPAGIVMASCCVHEYTAPPLASVTAKSNVISLIVFIPLCLRM